MADDQEVTRYPSPVGTVPMLSAVPDGALDGNPKYAPQRHIAEVLHSDRTWRRCMVIAWARYRDSWAALIRWQSGQEDWRQFDPRSLRPR